MGAVGEAGDGGGRAVVVVVVGWVGVAGAGGRVGELDGAEEVERLGGSLGGGEGLSVLRVMCEHWAKSYSWGDSDGTRHCVRCCGGGDDQGGMKG